MPDVHLHLDCGLNFTMGKWLTGNWCSDAALGSGSPLRVGLCNLLGADQNRATSAGIGGIESDSWWSWFASGTFLTRLQLRAWYSDGLFGFIGRLTSWASTQVCMFTLGERNCERAIQFTSFVVALLLLAIICYGLDWLFRPFFYVVSRVYRCYRWVMGIPDEINVGTLNECEWRGPEVTAVDNTFLKDHIRARSMQTRKPQESSSCSGCVVASTHSPAALQPAWRPS